jgi:hypothetical protein
MTKKPPSDPFLEEHVDGLRVDFAISEHPKYLAEYIERGGEIGDDPLLHKYLVHKYLANLIREHAPKPRGNKDSLRDVDVYQIVEWWRLMNDQDSKQRKKRPSLQEAFRHFEEDDPEAKMGTFQKQYERGRKLMNPEYKE